MSRVFTVPKEIRTGVGAVESALDLLATQGKKAFIVTGPHVVKLECFTVLTDTLTKGGIAYTVFSGITGEPTDAMIEEGLALYQSSGCDFLIGIGGGSPLDSIKAIAVLDTLGGTMADYMGISIEATFPPMVAIPTTAGTGSEATKFTIITDSAKDVKMLLKGDNLLPDVAIIDPAFSLTSPPSITASTGLDALTHAVESYTSKLAQPLTDALAMSAIKRIFRYLPTAYSDGNNLAARSELAIAALEGGIVINNASVTIVHGMSRPIGALFHVAHGTSNAMLLPSCMAFAMDGALDRFADLGRAIDVATSEDSDQIAAERFIAALAHLCATCEIPTLAEYGIPKEAFFAKIDKMATDALASGSPANTRKPVTKEDMVALYHELYEPCHP